MNWQEVIDKFPEANFLQSPECGKMHELLGEKVIIENYGKDGKEGHALMVVRNAKRGRYLEIACGPLIDWQDKRIVDEALSKIRLVAKREKCVFVRMRPQLRASKQNCGILEKNGLRKSPMHLAAEHTVMIDLTRDEEKMLADMRRQTRYDIRRAEKLGITVERDNSEKIFKEFHKVQMATAKRQGFVPPDLETLLAEREAFGENIWIYVAKTPEKCPKEAPSVFPKSAPIAYGLVIRDGEEGDYYEAASTELNHKLPGAYALLWQAMKDLKAEGCQRFNLWGIAPAGQPHHRYAGVTTFKTGFGGEIVEYVPAHDLVISKIKYLKNLAVETARKKKRHL